jgi:phosphatidylglycerophosphatase A
MNKFISTFCYIGFLPGAPGTFGSLVAIPIGYAIHVWGGFLALIFCTTIVFFLGCYSVKHYVIDYNTVNDPSEVVIDEVVGQWISLLPFSFGLWIVEGEKTFFPYPGLILAFVFFRIFDIWKPWPVSWADQKPTAMGVMLDDVLAGLYAALLITVLAVVFYFGKIL